MRRAAALGWVLALLAGCTASDPPPSTGAPANPPMGNADAPVPMFAPPDPGNPAPSPTPGDAYLTADQKAVAEAMTSIWENDTPKLAYGYAQNIKDGRGYTNGRAGFCTGTGDAIQVVACYDQLRTAANGNLLTKYLPALSAINAQFMSSGQDQGSTASLDAVGPWVSDWGASYSDPNTQADFKRCQDQISDLLYYTPAMQAATALGLDSALSRAALYDMWINQGDDKLVKQTSAALSLTGKVGSGVSEDQWLKKFIELRRDLLAGDSTWASSVDRMAGYEKARRRGDWDLSKAVDSAVKATQCWPGGGYLDSQYSSYSIQPDASWAPSAAATGCQ